MIINYAKLNDFFISVGDILKIYIRIFGTYFSEYRYLVTCQKFMVLFYLSLLQVLNWKNNNKQTEDMCCKMVLLSLLKRLFIYGYLWLVVIFLFCWVVWISFNKILLKILICIGWNKKVEERWSFCYDTCFLCFTWFRLLS